MRIPSLLQANAMKIPLKSKSVDCVCSSPPYWSLRDYGVEGQLGLESTPELYIENTLLWAAEVWRVLKDAGTFWLNIGDSYAGSWGAMSHDLGNKAKRTGSNKRPPTSYKQQGLKPKDLVGIPWMVAFALRDAGWYLRMDNIWWKTNPMPESVQGWRWERHRIKVKNVGRGEEEYRKVTGQQDHAPDGSFKSDAVWEDCLGCDKCINNDLLVLRKGSGRTTKSHEYIFQFTKSAEYYYDADAIREGNVNPNRTNYQSGSRSNGANKDRNDNDLGERSASFVANGRNKRSVWKIATQPYSGAHFATFPMAIPEICIKAGTSEKGNCEECGKPWARVVDHTNMVIERSDRTHDKGRTRSSGTMVSPAETKTIDWRATCEHKDAGVVPAVVLDPFGGSGTTAMVASKLGRHGISLELSAEYIELARERTGIKAMDRWWKAAMAGDVEELKKIQDPEDLTGLPLFGEINK